MSTTDLSTAGDVRRGRTVGDLRWHKQRWERWSGRRWARAAYSLQPDLLTRPDLPGTWPLLDRDRRDRGLALAVENQVSHNRAHVLYEGPHGVVLGYRTHVSHLLHALLTLLTAGLWVFVWLGVVAGRREQRIRLEIDRWGHVWAVPGRPA
jgi:hypothetical protein